MLHVWVVCVVLMGRWPLTILRAFSCPTSSSALLCSEIDSCVIILINVELFIEVLSVCLC